MIISGLKDLQTALEIRGLMSRYIYFADSKDWVSISLLFTPEGILKFLDVDGLPILDISGRDNIAIEVFERLKDAQIVHSIFSHEIEVISSNLAAGVFATDGILIYFTGDETGEDGSKLHTSVHGYGSYNAKFIKVGKIWYISELILKRTRLDFG